MLLFMFLSLSLFPSFPSYPPLRPLPHSLAQAYMAFLAGDDDFQALEDDLAQGFHARNEEIAAATEQLREEEAAQEAELATFGAAPSPLEQLEKSKADFTLDVQKFNTLIANLTAHHKKVQARLQKLQAEDRSRDEELESLAGNIARLQAVKDQQEMTPADVDRINSARTQLDHQSAQITARKVRANGCGTMRDGGGTNNKRRQQAAIPPFHMSSPKLLSTTHSLANHPSGCLSAYLPYRIGWLLVPLFAARSAASLPVLRRRWIKRLGSRRCRSPSC